MRDLETIAENEFGIKDSSEIIKETDLKLFFKCPYSYYLRNHIGLSKIPMTGAMLAGIFLKKERKNLFYVGDVFDFDRRAGPDSKHIEQMAGEEFVKYVSYKSAESFGKAAMMKWHMFIDKIMEKEDVVWSKKGERGLLGYHLMKACENYYNFILSNGVPNMGAFETQKTFSFEGLKFKISLPELRTGFIDDLDLHGFQQDISKSQLVTLRMLGYASLLRNYEFYQRRWNVDEDLAERLRAGEFILVPNLRYRHIDLSRNEIAETKRNDSEVVILRKAIEVFLNKVELEEFPVNINNCAICSYNLLGANYEPLCPKIVYGKKSSAPEEMFKKKTFIIESAVKDDGINFIGRIKKEKKTSKGIVSLAKDVASLNLTLHRLEDRIDVASSYNSRLFGFEFEIRMLKEADKVLNDLYEKDKKKIVHTIDFYRNFKVDGQMNIRKRLRELGYKEERDDRILYFVKEYS